MPIYTIEEDDFVEQAKKLILELEMRYLTMSKQEFIKLCNRLIGITRNAGAWRAGRKRKYSDFDIEMAKKDLAYKEFFVKKLTRDYEFGLISKATYYRYLKRVRIDDHK